jgi:hypothetical protein
LRECGGYNPLNEEITALLKPFGVIKVKGKYEDLEGFSSSPCPNPIKIFFGQGFTGGSLHSEYWGIEILSWNTGNN